MKRKKVNNVSKKFSDKKYDDSIFGISVINNKYIEYIIPSFYFIIILIIGFTYHRIGDYGVETDFYWTYIPEAKEFLKGNFIIDAYRGPVYQIVLGIFAFIFGKDFFSAGMFINILCSSLSLYFIFKTINSISTREIAFLTVLLTATNQYFIKFSYSAGTDMLFLVFYFASLYYILKDNGLNHKNFISAGIYTGLAYLTRYTGISLIIFAILIFTLHFSKWFKLTKSFIKSLNIKAVVSYLIPLVFFITSWGIFCQFKTGKFFYNLNYQNTAFAVYAVDEITNEEWTSNYQHTFQSMKDVIFRDFGVFLNKIFVKNFSSYFVRDLYILLPLIFGILTAFGLIIFLVKFKLHNRREKLIMLAGLIFYFQILLTFYSERFSLPLLPIYCYLIAKLFNYDFIGKFKIGFLKTKLLSAAIVISLSCNLYYSYEFVTVNFIMEPVDVLYVRDYVKKNIKENLSEKIIMSRKPHIAYYLDMQFKVIPSFNSPKELMDIIRKENADYIYISHVEISRFDRKLKPFLNEQNPPEGFEVITYVPDPFAILYKVYK